MIRHLDRHYDNLSAFMKHGRVTIIYGPRRVGKTTLVQRYLSSQTGRLLEAVGDDIRIRNLLSGHDRNAILTWAEGSDLIFIDEAQRIPEIGVALKILVDARPDIPLIATGSSSFELAGNVSEHLTGRQTPLILYPLSLFELAQTEMNQYRASEQLPEWLIYGMYPEVLNADTADDKRFILEELASSHLFKDILELDRIRSSKALVDLLVLIAFQVGNEVSLNELASNVGIDIKTVARYLDLCEKAFILYNLRGYSRNLRSEITSKSKYYFYDTGIRNALINNFNPISLRNDVGALWENWMVVERLKTRMYRRISANDYFWRTWEQREVDLIEQHGDELRAFEFKWSMNKSPRPPRQFLQAYPESSFESIHRENFLPLLRPVP